jgi:hypothetical protein
VRTLRAGNYQFLTLGGPKKGILVRYKVADSTLECCLSIGSSVEFVESRYPRATNIRRNTGEGTYLTVGVLDSTVLRILSALPDRDEYWACGMKYEKRP